MITAKSKSFKLTRVLLLFGVFAAAFAVASLLAFAPVQQASANQGDLSAAQLQAQGKESLNGKSGTREIETGEVYFGSFPLLSEEEQDEIGSVRHNYVFTVDKTSEVTFEITTDGVPYYFSDGVDDEWFGVTLSGDSLESDCKMVIYGGGEWKSGCVYLQPGTYTATVTVRWIEYGDADGMLGADYSIRVNAKSVARAEAEPNDTFKDANAVKLNKAINGSGYAFYKLTDDGYYACDKDYYSFELTEKTKVYLRVLSDVAPEYAKDDLEDQTRVAEAFIQKKDGGKRLFSSQVYGAKDWWSKGVTLQPGTYRACLSVAEDNALWGRPYKFTVVKKKANTLTAKPAAKTLSAKASKTVKIAKKKAFAIKKAKGAVTFVKKSGSKSITVNKKTGAITVKKGLKAKTYTLKVKVKAAGNKFYKSGEKLVTLKVKVK